MKFLILDQNGQARTVSKNEYISIVNDKTKNYDIHRRERLLYFAPPFKSYKEYL